MMKSFFKKLAFVMALAMVVTLAAPAAKTAVAADEKKPLAIAYQEGAKITELNLVKVGDTEDLRFLYAPTNYKELGVAWSSTNPNVVSVDDNGVVKAEAAGTATISVAVGTETASIEVYSVDTKTFVATMGTADNREMSEATLEVGKQIDFAFYGIYDYSADRYRCDWFAVDPDGVLEFDDKTGLAVAVKPGTAKISLGVMNLKTGIKTDVAPCVITVPAEEPEVTPAPAKSLEAKQTTEDTIVVTLTGVDVTTLNKFNIEVYEQYEDEYEYIWQLFSATPDKDKNTVTLVGYDELTHNTDYVVRLVTEENGDVITDELGNAVEDEFTASVGPVNRIEASYKSYKNNQGGWSFPNVAYTNGSEGEEIVTKLSYKLFDANEIDVTDHYKAVGYDVVTYDIIDDELSTYVNFVNDDEITFSEILDEPLKIMVTYEDYDDILEEVNTKSTPLVLNVKKAPEYKASSIEKWAINNLGINGKEFNQDIALNDDYDFANDYVLSNHELVLWFTDNYGNKFVTKNAYVGDGYQFIEDNAKFTNEGYEIRYESRNPQVLVIGDEEEFATTSDVINTKKVGTATINVTLHNTLRDYEDATLVSYMGIVRIPVKEQRKLTTVDVANVNVTSDSIAEPNSADDYDDRFTKTTVNVVAKDQYGVEWGYINSSVLADTYLTIETVNDKHAGVTILVGEDMALNKTGNNDGVVYGADVDGYELFAETGEDDDKSTSTVQYSVTIRDDLKEITKTDKFTVTMKQPTHDEAGNIVTNSVLNLTAGNVGITDLKTTIKVIEKSRNGLEVNYKDDITPIFTKDAFNKLFSKDADDFTPAAKDDLFIVLYDSKKAIVNEATADFTIGLQEEESGLYTFYVATLNQGSERTVFATTGTYKVQLLQVTNVNDNGMVTGYRAIYTENFQVSDNRISVALKEQKKIYLDSSEANDVIEIATAAFNYSVDLSKTNPNDKSRVSNDNIVDVRFRVSEKMNYVVIQDVFMKVLLDTNFRDGIDAGDDGSFYYIEVPVDRTVRLEDASMASGESVKVGKDPEGNKMR